MGIEFFTATLNAAREEIRERAVQASGALRVGDSPELQALVEKARRDFGTSMAAVSIVSRDWQYLIAAAGLLKGVYSRRASICGHTISRPERVFCVAEAALDPRFVEDSGAAEDDGLGFYAGATLLDQNEMRLGAFCVFGPKCRAVLTVNEAARLGGFADAAMAIIEARMLRG